MEYKNEKIRLDVIRTGGIMAQKLALKNGISVSLKEWNELKALKSKESESEKYYPDSFIYTFTAAGETLVLHEHHLPAKWKSKLEKYYD